MRRATLPLLILGCIVVAAALAWWTLNRGGNSGTGGAAVVTENRAVGSFRKLDIAGNLDVTLVPSASEEVVVEAPPGMQSRVRARVEGGTLTIAGGETRRWWSGIVGGSRGAPTPRVTVNFRTLDTISLAGSVRLSAAKLDADTLRISAAGGSALRIDDLQAQSLKLSGAGALKATLAGNVVDQQISISGAGEVRAGQLVSDNAQVSVSGAGSIVLNVRKTLRASISGAGSVEYYGDPEVRQQVSGVGRVKRRESARADGMRVAGGGASAAQCSASARNSSGTPVAASRSAWTPGSTRSSATRKSRSSAVSICTTSALRSTA
ncbi:MAG: head GIN domain-containing protein [Betaproteobacteria bacterium]